MLVVGGTANLLRRRSSPWLGRISASVVLAACGV